MMKDRTAERIQREFDRDTYDIINSIGLITMLCMNNVKPVEIIIDGKLKNGMNKKAGVYLKDDKEYKSIKNDWDNGEYDIYKLYNKKCGKVKRMLINGDISVLD